MDENRSPHYAEYCNGLYTLSIQVMNQVSENLDFLKQILNFALNSIEASKMIF